MSKIVNLRRFRKTKARDAANSEADANRLKHGTPKAVRNASKAETEGKLRALDAHKLDKN
jgi:Domain of unknown function (DUF4169)